MHPETLFVAAYAASLTMVGVGLHHLGRRIRARAANGLPAGRHARRNVDETSNESLAWPHTEAPLLYTVIGLVAGSAAVLLVVVEGFRHHRTTESLLLAVVMVGALATIATLARTLRAAIPIAPATNETRREGKMESRRSG